MWPVEWRSFQINSARLLYQGTIVLSSNQRVIGSIVSTKLNLRLSNCKKKKEKHLLCPVCHFLVLFCDRTKCKFVALYIYIKFCLSIRAFEFFYWRFYWLVALLIYSIRLSRIFGSERIFLNVTNYFLSLPLKHYNFTNEYMYTDNQITNEMKEHISTFKYICINKFCVIHKIRKIFSFYNIWFH